MVKITARRGPGAVRHRDQPVEQAREPRREALARVLRQPVRTHRGRRSRAGAALLPREVEALDLGGERRPVPRRHSAGAGVPHQARRLVILSEQRQDRAAGVEVLVDLGRDRGVAAHRLPQDERVGGALQGPRLRVRDRPREVHDALEAERQRAVLVVRLVRAGQACADAAPGFGPAREQLVERLEQRLHVGRQRQQAGEDDEEVVGVACRGTGLPAPVGLEAVGQALHLAAGGRGVTGQRGGVGAGGHEHEVGGREHAALHVPLPCRVPGGRRAAPVEVDPRVAEIGDPGQAEAAGERPRREVHAVGRRAREHGVHVTAGEPRRRDAARPGRPTGVGVGQQPPVRERAQPAEDRPGAPAAATAQPQPRRQRAAAGHADHLGRRRDLPPERLIPHPVVLRSRAHHRAVPAVFRQPAREAEGALHAAAPERGIEVT
jgi:hypothetical protein